MLYHALMFTFSKRVSAHLPHYTSPANQKCALPPKKPDTSCDERLSAM